MLIFGDDDIKILPSNCFVRFKQTIVSTQSSTSGFVVYASDHTRDDVCTQSSDDGSLCYHTKTTSRSD